MNHWPKELPRAARWLAFASLALAAASAPLRAGDAIVLPEKGQTAPARESNLGKGLFGGSSPWEHSFAPSPLDGITPPTLPRIRQVDPKTERRLEN